MPTYEYECQSCEHRFEKFQAMTADPLRDCPECGKGVKRLISSGAGILFKGKGFYQTDYRSKNYKQAAQKDTPPKESSCPAAKECQKANNCPAAKDS